MAPPPGGPIQADGARAIDEFPELLALEYQFQARLAHARGLDGEDDEGVNTSLEEGGEASAVSVAKEVRTDVQRSQQMIVLRISMLERSSFSPVLVDGDKTALFF